jgi:dTDP-6-deoxy-L-talose 4-dehydrogenase (NAD+)
MIKKKYLVTGAGGYLGKYVVKQLLDKGNEVIAADFCVDNIDNRAIKINEDIFKDCANIYNRLGSPDVCIHLAWKDGFVHNSEAHMGNLSTHYQFITSMINQGLQHVAVMGTMHEVGYHEGMVDENTICNPLSQYGIAKDALRRSLLLYTNDKSVTFQWLRGYYIYGDDLNNHSIFSIITKLENEGKKTFPFTTGENKCDFISVEELAMQITSVAMQTKVDGIINCCSGKPMALKEMVEKFIIKNNFKIRPEYGIYPSRKYDSPIIYGSNEKITQILEQ